MEVEFAEKLKPELTAEKTGLRVQAKFVPDEEIESGYLNRPYGNTYFFDQEERLDGIL